ncbi:MAG: hypothetical protein K1X74_10185 [Pirellulales bacterium]|nr:hypothetical protein [Pirellulales bacterium]
MSASPTADEVAEAAPPAPLQVYDDQAEQLPPAVAETPAPVVAEVTAAVGLPVQELEPAPVEPAVAQEDKVRAPRVPKLPNDEQPREEQPKIDPVKVNGPIFVGDRWQHIDVAIVITGEQLGYLEPCGCAGLENMKGGFKRRFTLIKQLREERGWPLVLLDLGGQVRRYGPQQEIKFDIALRGLRQMGYNAVALGAQELQLSTESLVAAAADDTNPFVVTNIEFNPETTGMDRIGQPVRVLQVGGHKIGVTAVLGKKYQRDIKNPDLKLGDPEAVLAQILPNLRKACDFVIVLSHAPVEESEALAKRFAEIDMIVTAGGHEEPPAEPLPIPGARGKLVEVGHKGMFAAVMGLSKQNPLRKLVYQRVPLDVRFVDDPEMQQLMVEYQESLQAATFAALCPPPAVHPKGTDAEDLRAQFVGSETCGTCHSQAYEKWQNTPHAHATDTLANISDPPRLHDPECLSCHVTGWNPQQYFAYLTGYTSIEETPALKGNGCENCHGPGAAHVDAETNAADNAEELRAAMRVTLAESEKRACAECHDHDNSPEFNFETYWKEIAHPWRD